MILSRLWLMDTNDGLLEGSFEPAGEQACEATQSRWSYPALQQSLGRCHSRCQGLLWWSECAPQGFVLYAHTDGCRHRLPPAAANNCYTAVPLFTCFTLTSSLAQASRHTAVGGYCTSRVSRTYSKQFQQEGGRPTCRPIQAM